MKNKEMVLKLENMVVFNGYVFITGRSKKFDKDLQTVMFLLSKKELNAAERMQLLTIYQSSYHESGKIEGVVSFDSSAHNCKFCEAMREKAKNNPAHICNYCYDYSQEEYKINSWNRHSLNMLIMSTIDFTEEELAIIPAGLIDRINSSGDIPNTIYARNMIRLAKVNKHGRFAFWAKNEYALVAATDQLGKPQNAIYIRSSEIIGRPAELPKYFNYVFTVYPDKESCEKAIAAGAAECNGKKCKECGYKCYFGTHESHNIAELLRGVSVNDRTEIMTWLENN